MLELIECLSSKLPKTSSFEDVLRDMSLQTTRIIVSWIESRRDKMFQSKISKLLVSKCFEHQYGICLLQNSTKVPSVSDAEEGEETNQERKIHPDDVKMMTQMIQDRFDSASSKHEHIQVGLELVLNHVGMPSSRDRIVNSVLASSTIPQDFFDDENNDPSKSSEDDEMMREIYYEYLSITPTTEFQVKKGERRSRYHF